MSDGATIIPAERLAERREGRERLRKERQAFVGSILEALTDEPEQRVCVASKTKEPTR